MMPLFSLAVLVSGALLIYFWNDLILKKTRLEYAFEAVSAFRKRLPETSGEERDELADALRKAEDDWREAAAAFRGAAARFPGKTLARAMLLEVEKLLTPPPGMEQENL